MPQSWNTPKKCSPSIVATQCSTYFSQEWVKRENTFLQRLFSLWKIVLCICVAYIVYHSWYDFTSPFRHFQQCALFGLSPSGGYPRGRKKPTLLTIYPFMPINFSKKSFSGWELIKIARSENLSAKAVLIKKAPLCKGSLMTVLFCKLYYHF